MYFGSYADRWRSPICQRNRSRYVVFVVKMDVDPEIAVVVIWALKIDLFVDFTGSLQQKNS